MLILTEALEPGSESAPRQGEWLQGTCVSLLPVPSITPSCSTMFSPYPGSPA